MRLETIRRSIENRVAEGATLDQIERALLRPLSWLEDDERSALWLYAWLLATGSGAGGPATRAA